MGEFPVAEGSEVVASLFWQPEPPLDYSHWFAIYYHPFKESAFITGGEKIATRIRTGVITPNGDFIYSRGRHDCVSHDGCMIDGGDAYVRTNGLAHGARMIKFSVENDKIMEVI